MARAATSMLALALLWAGGCSNSGRLQIRPVGEAHSAQRPVSEEIAVAAGELAIGNVGLALESYRKAARNDPANVDALGGIAACYDRMGRFDLSRRAYEEALALAPDDPALYQALAASLDAEGLGSEAAAVRREAAGRLAAVAAPVVTAAGSVAILPQLVEDARPAPAVTVLLAPPRLAAALPPAAVQRLAPRLERLSGGEVALLTSGVSPWTMRAIANAPRIAALPAERRATLLILNAARRQGLAARTRDYLAARGFSGSRIGDAPQTSWRTLIRFAPAERQRALRIAAQFPFARPVAVARGPLTLVVGRDAPSELLRRG